MDGNGEVRKKKPFLTLQVSLEAGRIGVFQTKMLLHFVRCLFEVFSTHENCLQVILRSLLEFLVTTGSFLCYSACLS